MSTRIFHILTLLTFCYACANTKPKVEGCLKAHTGQFTKILRNNSGLGHWTELQIAISRSGNKQIEEMEKPFKSKRIYQLEWISDCVYTIKITAISDLGDSLFSKQFPYGQKISIRKFTADYIIEKPEGGEADTLWLKPVKL